MGYGCLAGYPPQFSTSCGKGISRMGKQKSGDAVKGRNAQQLVAAFISEWKQASEFLKAFHAFCGIILPLTHACQRVHLLSEYLRCICTASGRIPLC
jgi:hypothetical protein